MFTRRTVLFGMAAMPVVLGTARAVAAIPTADTLTTSAGDVTIQPLNHATLVLSQGAHVLYIDPAKVDFAGQKPATAILITHEHGDHFDPDNLSRIAGSAAIVAPQSVADKIPAALKGQVTAMKTG
ncbi:MAG TPA: MBL fold metallo-hydrolase, partial [Bryobacteraceae bacterium]|nr:MBL fold metallo-hydrolase [Bryobacteraceae bacterium]